MPWMNRHNSEVDDIGSDRAITLPMGLVIERSVLIGNLYSLAISAGL
ncbi:hypothetical protein V7x_50500 [Crateriforma conspicua]|uniref:Uncharacterized protein n=1 Tax=Crateriforma conspicua TaxID=2527996 RepID=A0A5C6FMC2_9PLAN|nr:hypothetical protein V7x_50500 [Crateriforma conspicua]